ncbi:MULTISPECIES: pyridoxamine 5'-phosphate oxidase family protein [Halomonadaceae]|uniref:Flavin-nucleotide-binding protein n=2 Tax=Halomonadaceae TaxID=28256 RepID=A0A2A2EUE3_9GAMM|nr:MULTISPECIES: pyridoxamine 5'-phosphate oxidase family protein [Halomonas]MDR5904780.1 pyridoxamine 5'-phosphate oxidase family protein [Halomonas qiaohouensis]PAU76094.1 flavin-nucleotide-binding protein [Halomonas salipaludis]
MTQLTPTDQTRVVRGAKRAVYDEATVHAIIDDALICHVAQILPNATPLVTPTAHWREGRWLYWHGLASTRNVADTPARPVSINICHVDGLVMARSAFHHSLNYRSVTLFGTPEPVTDPAEKTRQLERFLDKISPGRWPQLRPINGKELKATGLVRLPIEEASAKVRNGPPVDDDEDYGWPVWAGVIPLVQHRGEPEMDQA